MNRTSKKYIVIIIFLVMIFTFCSLAVMAQIQRIGGKSPFDRDDRNCDERLSPEEFRGPAHEFTKRDKNGDGFITREESEEARQRGQQRIVSEAGGQRQAQQGPGELVVYICQKDKVCNGTRLFAITHPENPRIVEVDLDGKVVWEYQLPDSLKKYTNPGLDVELLANNNILVVFPRKGVYEINRNGEIVWKYLDNEISHDADRLKNGNTIFVWGGGDKKDDAQVKEVDPTGKIVWLWKAKKDFNKDPYQVIDKGGWTHTNAVTRLKNGNTVICMRNFYLTVEVDPQGELVWSYDWSSFGKNVDPHEPEILPNDNMLIAIQNDAPYQAVEIDRATGETIWKFSYPGLRTTRDADRLPNGNTLLVGVLKGEEESVILEVTPAGEVVWKLGLKNLPAQRDGRRSPGWFYKAEVIPQQ
ncbi:MAG: aryl-sulfate sulfotransferase [PVC group bacterium]